jgi:hypothetical protein
MSGPLRSTRTFALGAAAAADDAVESGDAVVRLASSHQKNAMCGRPMPASRNAIAAVMAHPVRRAP